MTFRGWQMILAGVLCLGVADCANTGVAPIIPIVQSLTSSTAVISFATLEPRATSLTIYDSSEKSRRIDRPGTSQWHRIELDGLKPESQYRYQIEGSQLTQIQGVFRTNVLDPNISFSFVVWGDSQSHPRTFSRLIRLMIQLQPDFAVSVGDLVDDGSDPEQWRERFLQPAAPLLQRMPVIATPGNHDLVGGARPSQFDTLFYRPRAHSYAVSYGNSRLIVLDPFEGGAVKFGPGSPEYDWLMSEMQSGAFARARARFLFVHTPPFAEKWNGEPYDGEENLRKYLVPLLEKYEVDVVFSGHVHEYERGQWPASGGVNYVVTGGGGGPLDDQKQRDWEQISMTRSEHHFCQVNVTPRRVRVTAIGVSGVVIDQFEKELTRPR